MLLIRTTCGISDRNGRSRVGSAAAVGFTKRIRLTPGGNPVHPKVSSSPLPTLLSSGSIAELRRSEILSFLKRSRRLNELARGGWENALMAHGAKPLSLSETFQWAVFRTENQILHGNELALARVALSTVVPDSRNDGYGTSACGAICWH
jgi:hypothetical protein